MTENNHARKPGVGAKISAAHKAANRTRERATNWKGGWRDKFGYVWFGDTKRSHVVWNDTHPDDPILPGQIIHHMNHVKDDDRPENLMKITQSDHAKHHDFGHNPEARRGSTGSPA